jgi:hypothetical protein
VETDAFSKTASPLANPLHHSHPPIIIANPFSPLPPMAKFTHLSHRRPAASRKNRSPQHGQAPPAAAPANPNILSGVSGESPNFFCELAEARNFLQRLEGACRCKAAYNSRREISTFLRHTGHAGSSYLCQCCDHWHITSMTKREQKTLVRKIRAAKKLVDDYDLAQSPSQPFNS